jgi:primosomal protein N'
VACGQDRNRCACERQEELREFHNGQDCASQKERWYVLNSPGLQYDLFINNILAASVHSRAAKRASSPGIDLDKSLKDVKPPETKTQRPSILAIHQGAGISKKSKNGRKAVLSAKAKRRQEKGMDRAEAVMDKKEKKVEKSKGKARTVQERAKAWDELNKKMLAKKAKEEALALEKLEKENWVDEDETEGEKMEDIEVENAPAVELAVSGVVPESVPLPEPAEDEDEIL